MLSSPLLPHLERVESPGLWPTVAEGLLGVVGPFPARRRRMVAIECHLEAKAAPCSEGLRPQSVSTRSCPLSLPSFICSREALETGSEAPRPVQVQAQLGPFTHKASHTSGRERPGHPKVPSASSRFCVLFFSPHSVLPPATQPYIFLRLREEMLSFDELSQHNEWEIHTFF